MPNGEVRSASALPRKQAVRSEETRAALMDATIACLVEEGYGATTTARVAERAGLSRGAHLHHFRTRDGLIAGAVERLSERLADEIDANLARLPDSEQRISSALDLLWDAFSSDLFVATVELWAIARTNADLERALAPLEQSLDRRVMHAYASLFPEQTGRTGSDELATFTLATIRGLALLDVVAPSGSGTAERWPYARRVLAEMLEGSD